MLFIWFYVIVSFKMKDFCMNINKILFSIFCIGTMSASLVSMDDIFKFARQNHIIDVVNYNIVDNGRLYHPVSFLGMMQFTNYIQSLKVQRMKDQQEEKEEMKKKFFQSLDPELEKKLAYVVQPDQEDYSPAEVKSNLFFLHVTTEAQKERDIFLNNLSAQPSPTQVSSSLIISPKSILKHEKSVIRKFNYSCKF